MSYGRTTWMILKSGRTHRGPDPGVWDTRPHWPMSPIMACGLIVPAEQCKPMDGGRTTCDLCERNMDRVIRR